MYKWPQGRVIRTICLILALVVAADLGYTGAFSKIKAALDSNAHDAYVRGLVYGIGFAVLAAAALVTGLVAAGFHKRAVDFLIEVEQEMVKVEWPQGGALVKSTVIIAVSMAILAGLIFGIDGIERWLLYDFIFENIGKRM
jgi:preprotein translocase SecE subunit